MNWIQKILSVGAPKEGDAEPDEERQDIEALMNLAFNAAETGDYETALGVWRRLAEQGWPRAQSNLGACYAEGLGVERDLELAAHWLAQAAEAGDAIGRRNLATMHFKGEGGVPQDDGEALRLFRLAAEQGDAAAQDMLSWMLLEGQGSDQDPVAARHWALAAAEQEVAAAMTRLGLIAHNALGMERDPEEAARWWYEAARRGEPDGQAMLGAALHLGSGVVKDDVAALTWLLRAETGGSALSGSFIAAVRARLAPDQVASAEDASRQPLDPGAAA